ncbi:MAG TPA: hypothetical protein VEB00_16365 [Clostridia bacterium]|nr:hypothetical protein [Clostridia bacterium]
MVKKILGWLLVPYIMVGILVKRKTQKTSLGILAGVICFFLVIGFLGSSSSNEGNTAQNTNSTKVEEKTVEVTPTPTPTPTPEPTPTLSPEEQEKLNYQAWIEGQFSAWDGSHKDLVKLIKDNMNDPKSFEHVETRYKDDGDGITVYMKFRGKNAFGGLVLNEVLAKADYKTNTIKIIANE